MNKVTLLLGASLFAIAGQAHARDADPAPTAVEPDARPAPLRKDADTVTTGVAKGRDRLDSATSTSSLREADIAKLAPQSIGELMRDIPGVRSEASNGEGNANISIRGLPIASSGAKFVQLEEDGLPVLEFGDIAFTGADMFLRADLSLQQVDVIRGGSASTFASNSPGGIINFISKTGETEGGAVALTSGLDYRQYRADFDYGLHLSDSLRLHVGGFYRQGEGPRRAGYDAQKGGQIKLNVTKTFPGGYIRLYGKYLDDRSPYYDNVPLRVSGTDGDPKYSAVANFDPTRDTLLSRYNPSITLLGADNTPTSVDLREGQHAVVKAFGVEARIDLGDWTVIEKFRFADIGGRMVAAINPNFLPAAQPAAFFAGPGARLSYASGPLAGTAIADPTTLNGNGLLVAATTQNIPFAGMDNVTNDLRASRTWHIGGGELTTTAGFYASRQAIDQDTLWTTQLIEVRGGGNAALIDVATAAGVQTTSNGVGSYTFAFAPASLRRRLRVDYGVNAPFASLNYHIGKVAIGGSLRYDVGSARGSIFGSELGGGRIGVVSRDMNGDGVLSPAETKVGVTPLTAPAPVDYAYRYLSYSAGVNVRIAEPFSVFGRYSRGARANADRILFSPIVSATTGGLNLPDAVYDPVQQAEIGAKYRDAGLTLNLTGFWAKAQDTNIDTTNGQPIARRYRAIGAEFEGGYRHGIFSLTAGATYTKARIVADGVSPEIVGNVPRHQADLIFQATPQITTDRFDIGAVFIGTTDSYAADANLLKMPGYVTTNAFVQFRLARRLQLSLNANNLFDTIAITNILSATIPANGVVSAKVLNGRTLSASARFDF
ncbi:TonB-dependent receptor [Sphingomonas sp. Leaf357]|uniref:TonB-dependent receptor domain-containing protein n=1 Tax=Sphingomonas sp. Leaf357 TaxID=1736350 RepID=UPI0006FCA8ED|nr:TonB-dependent receptor [Sphingomonas sp. Leaf357]KQS03345.1 TonB-dependent receptor [Sphingomonas sp. Leaf357]